MRQLRRALYSWIGNTVEQASGEALPIASRRAIWFNIPAFRHSCSSEHLSSDTDRTAYIDSLCLTAAYLHMNRDRPESLRDYSDAVSWFTDCAVLSDRTVLQAVNDENLLLLLRASTAFAGVKPKDLDAFVKITREDNRYRHMPARVEVGIVDAISRCKFRTTSSYSFCRELAVMLLSDPDALGPGGAQLLITALARLKMREAGVTSKVRKLLPSIPFTADALNSIKQSLQL